MANFLKATQARQNSLNDMTVFDETTAIMREIINQSEKNEFDATIGSTTMTTSVKIITIKSDSEVTSDVQNGDTVIINGTTVTLGISGLTLNAVIADINDAEISGVTADKTVDNRIQITYNADLDEVLSIGPGTANAVLGLTEDEFNSDLPSSTDYYLAWINGSNSAALINQMNAVIAFFQNLGYTIERRTDTNQQTFSWRLYW